MSILHTTRALCPECMRVLPAQIETDAEQRVWMVRTCPEHGEIRSFVWPDANHYQKMGSLAFPQVRPAQDSLHPTNLPCPTGCGICQRHRRKPTLVEIEVTQRCNLHCPVCFMSAEAAYTDVPLERLDGFYEAIVQSAGTQTGVQITGGEPTVRDDLAQIIRMGRKKGFWGIEVNTNGLIIAQDNGYLEELVEAGLTGIYLQFDGVSAEPYRQIRGADLLATKLRAVERCREAGVQVVLAMTIVDGINAHEVGAVIDYALDNVDVIAGVALQPAFTSGRFDASRKTPLTMGDVMVLLEEQTHGLIRIDDIWPLGCSHPLCDTGTYLVQDATENATGVATATAAATVALETMPATTTAAAAAATRAATTTAEKVVAFVPVTRDLTREDYLALYNPDSPQGSVFGDIVAKRQLTHAKGLSVIIMNYMDAWSMDLERIEECSMFVTMADGRLLPFCSYQLTSCAGHRVHSPWGMSTDEMGAVRWSASEVGL